MVRDEGGRMDEAIDGDRLQVGRDRARGLKWHGMVWVGL